MLGFHFSSRPTVSRHIEVLRKRFRARMWIFVHLRNAGFNNKELVKVYKSILRPVHDYLSIVFHPMLTDAQDEALEQLQSWALKYIFGWQLSYARTRELAGIETLRVRRVDSCDKFAAKCLGSKRFASWFPLQDGGVRRSARFTSGEKYQEFFARCDHLKNSPLFYMRRRLNGKQGKAYGKRNAQYRD